MTSYITAIVSVILIIFGLGQSTAPKFQATPDGFMGLTLDSTTIAETESRLGPPDDDKMDKLEVSKLEKWLDPKHKEKIFRQLTYKKSPDFIEIKLSFLDDKLVMIDLAYKKRVAPDKLNGLFRAQFAHLGGPASLPDQPGKYPMGFIATHLPALYSMVAISDKTFIFVNCASEGGGRSPGRVERTRQVSRQLERK
jgi:hypothetical protein